MTIHQLTDATIADFLAKAEKPVLLAIGASWCIDCQRLQPLFMTMAETYGNDVLFASIDMDNNPDVCADYNVVHIPHFFHIVDGKVVSELIEPKSIAPFKNFVESMIGSAQ